MVKHTEDKEISGKLELLKGEPRGDPCRPAASGVDYVHYIVLYNGGSRPWLPLHLQAARSGHLLPCSLLEGCTFLILSCETNLQA